jgi:hypothetical protein
VPIIKRPIGRPDAGGTAHNVLDGRYFNSVSSKCSNKRCNIRDQRSFEHRIASLYAAILVVAAATFYRSGHHDVPDESFWPSSVGRDAPGLRLALLSPRRSQERRVQTLKPRLRKRFIKEQSEDAQLTFGIIGAARGWSRMPGDQIPGRGLASDLGFGASVDFLASVLRFNGTSVQWPSGTSAQRIGEPGNPGP